MPLRDHGIERAAEVSGGHAEHEADDERDRGGADPHDQRGPRSVEEADEHVAAEAVGAEDEERAVRVRLAVVADLVAERRQRNAVEVEPVEELLVDAVPGERAAIGAPIVARMQQEHEVAGRRRASPDRRAAGAGTAHGSSRREPTGRCVRTSDCSASGLEIPIAMPSARVESDRRTRGRRRRVSSRHLDAADAPARAGSADGTWQPDGGESGLGGSPLTGAAQPTARQPRVRDRRRREQRLGVRVPRPGEQFGDASPSRRPCRDT